MEDGAPKKFKRKRKKTFIRNARKYAKKGCFGRGFQVEEDVYQYLVRVLEAFREGFPSEEEQKIFASNVFEQMENKEVDYSCNQIGSRVIETLLPLASNETLKKYFDAFHDNIRRLANECFASHVLKGLLLEAGKRIKEPFCDDFYMKVSKFLLNNMEDYMWDTYGNHSMRVVFISILKLPSNDVLKYQCEIDDKHKEILEEYAKRLLLWPQFRELPQSDISSGFLQVLLKSLKVIKSKLLPKYIEKLIDESFAPEKDIVYDSNNWPPVFMSKSCLMLLETALLVVKSKGFIKLYERCFKGLIFKLASTKSTSFCIQKFFNSIKEKIQLDEIFDEFGDNYAEIVNSSHAGVLLALGQACKRFATKQGAYIQNIMKAFNCFEPEERQSKIVLCLCKLTTFEDLSKQNLGELDKEKLNLQGTLIVQLMLSFNKPIKIINSLLSLQKQELAALLSNTMGSHLTNSFFESEFVGEKSKEKLIRMLSGFYQDLAASKYGSRSFDLIWEAASLKSKGTIMEELSYKDAAWSNTQFGKIISSKIHLHTYKQNKEEWESVVTSGNKGKKLKTNLLEEILGPSSVV